MFHSRGKTQVRVVCLILEKKKKKKQERSMPSTVRLQKILKAFSQTKALQCSLSAGFLQICIQNIFSFKWYYNKGAKKELSESCRFNRMHSESDRSHGQNHASTCLWLRGIEKTNPNPLRNKKIHSHECAATDRMRLTEEQDVCLQPLKHQL